MEEVSGMHRDPLRSTLENTSIQEEKKVAAAQQTETSTREDCGR